MLVRDEDKDLDRVAEVVVEIINEKLRGGDSYWRLLLQTARAETLGLTAGSALGFGLQSPDGKTQPLVFLCHSSGDKEQVRALYRTLNADGIECWFDEEDLLPGQDWGYEIGRAIKRSKFVLACVSKASITKSGYVQKELKKALDVADEQPEGVAFLIPVRLEECEIPDRLSQWQWVDLFVDGGYQRLLRVLKAPQNSGN